MCKRSTLSRRELRGIFSFSLYISTFRDLVGKEKTPLKRGLPEAY